MQLPSSIENTPIHSLIRNEWRRIVKRFGTTEIDEADYLLYTIWLIDTLCDSADHSTSPEDFKDLVYGAVRSHLQDKGSTVASGDIEEITNSLFDVQYYLWGLILLGCESLSVDVIDIESLLDKCIGKRRQASIDFTGSFHSDDVASLKQWMLAYIESDEALTASSRIEWSQAIVAEQNKALTARTVEKGNTTIIVEHAEFNGLTQIGALVGRAGKIQTDNGE